jgi:iron(III) transport system ATP-binding protein
MIEVNDETKSFGKVVAVDHVSLEVKEGEILGLLGPSGCGKTTILRSIAGLEQINEGEISLDGQVVTSPKKKIFLPAEKRKLGFVFQSYALWPHMTAYDNVKYCLSRDKLSRPQREERIKEVFDLVGLSGLEKRYPFELSGGQQQRVALARNLSYHPKVLLLDEPLSNLDLQIREKVRSELRTLLRRIGITTVFVTHDQDEAFVISDRTIVLNAGRVVQSGSARELFSRPVNAFVAEFLGRRNILGASLVEILPDIQSARIMIREFGCELVCQYNGDDQGEFSHVTIRNNEMSLHKSRPQTSDNVVEGKIESMEYKGSVIDYKVRVGDARITVTMNSLDYSSEESFDVGSIFVTIPPGSIKPMVS